MVQGITSGMLCLGENKLYTKAALGKIGLAIFICMIGIWRLLQKNSTKGKSDKKKQV